MHRPIAMFVSKDLLVLRRHHAVVQMFQTFFLLEAATTEANVTHKITVFRQMREKQCRQLPLIASGEQMSDQSISGCFSLLLFSYVYNRAIQ